MFLSNIYDKNYHRRAKREIRLQLWRMLELINSLFFGNARINKLILKGCFYKIYDKQTIFRIVFNMLSIIMKYYVILLIYYLLTHN